MAMLVGFRRLIAASALVLASSFSLAGLAPAQAAMGSGGRTVTVSTVAGPYRLTLDVGPIEQMWSMADLKTKHPTGGEVMISGSMVMGGMGMNSPMPNHHLELHVYRKSTGKVVTNAMVSIAVYSAKGKLLDKVPIAVMQGVKAGIQDRHYGNNVYLKDGTYSVHVQVGMTKATFMITIGSSGMSM
jgi:hypothetical protein